MFYYEFMSFLLITYLEKKKTCWMMLSDIRHLGGRDGFSQKGKKKPSKPSKIAKNTFKIGKIQ